jgi:hypothetical protein
MKYTRGNMRTKLHQTKKQHPKMRGGMSEDNEQVKLFLPPNEPLSCSICKSDVFMKRDATFKKSKTQQVFTSFINMNDNPLNDISVTCYFCSNCGNGMMVRSPVQGVLDGPSQNYKNLITAQPLNNQPQQTNGEQPPAKKKWWPF